MKIGDGCFSVDRCANPRRYMLKIEPVDWNGNTRVNVSHHKGRFEVVPSSDGEYSAQVKNQRATIYITAKRGLGVRDLSDASKRMYMVTKGKDSWLACPTNESLAFFHTNPYMSACLTAIGGLMAPMTRRERWDLVESLWNMLESNDKKLRETSK